MLGASRSPGDPGARARRSRATAGGPVAERGLGRRPPRAGSGAGVARQAHARRARARAAASGRRDRRAHAPRGRAWGRGRGRAPTPRRRSRWRLEQRHAPALGAHRLEEALAPAHAGIVDRERARPGRRRRPARRPSPSEPDRRPCVRMAAESPVQGVAPCRTRLTLARHRRAQHEADDRVPGHRLRLLAGRRCEIDENGEAPDADALPVALLAFESGPNVVLTLPLATSDAENMMNAFTQAEPYRQEIPDAGNWQPQPSGLPEGLFWALQPSVVGVSVTPPQQTRRRAGAPLDARLRRRGRQPGADRRQRPDVRPDRARPGRRRPRRDWRRAALETRNTRGYLVFSPPPTDDTRAVE